MKLKYLLLSCSMLASSNKNKKFSKSQNTEVVTVNVTNENVPLDLKEAINKRYSNKNPREKEFLAKFIVLVDKAIRNSSYFPSIEKKYNSKKTLSFYENYLLLLELLSEEIFQERNETQGELQSLYRFDSMEKETNHHYMVKELIGVSETTLEEILKIIKHQQNKDFYVTNEFKNQINQIIDKCEQKKDKILTVENIYLQGEYMGFQPLSEEFLSMKNLLDKYYVWFLAKSPTQNTFTVTLITKVEISKRVSYDVFIKNLKLDGLRMFISNIIDGKTNSSKYIYQIDKKPLLEILDGEIAAFLFNS
jgi:hypothetical protein